MGNQPEKVCVVHFCTLPCVNAGKKCVLSSDPKSVAKVKKYGMTKGK